MKKRLLGLIICVILAVLALAGCDEAVKHDVVFMVDGIEYASVSTAGEETLTMPDDPTKEGCIFDGWYLDNGVWENSFTAKSLIDIPLNINMCVYAKWIPEDTLRSTDIRTKTLSKDGTHLTITLSSSTKSFNFTNEIEVADGATFTVYKDALAEHAVKTRTVSLSPGDNTVYIIVENKNDICLYTVAIYRKYSYTVEFVTNNGTYISDQNIEEGKLATRPSDLTREGYLFDGWDFDFNTPINSNKTVTAKWISTNPLKGTEIMPQTLSMSGQNLYILLPNDAVTFSFEKEIKVADDASFTVCSDALGTNVITDKIVSLEPGDNTVYVIVKNSGATSVYTAVIHKTIVYEVSFVTGNEKPVEAQYIDEGKFATKPDDPTKVGYIFSGWDFDFTTPINSNKTVTAQWVECEHPNTELNETCNICGLELICEHIDENKDNECEICGENATVHNDENKDGICDDCFFSIYGETEIIRYPWADEEPVQLIFQMTNSSNGQSLPSSAQRYLAGEMPGAIDEIDSMVADRNAAAYIDTNIDIKYQYYDDNGNYGWSKTIDIMYAETKSGSPNIPDMYCNFTYDLVGASLKGAFANILSQNYNYHGANYFEFLRDGWGQQYDDDGYSVGYMYEYMQSMTLNKNKMYIIASDYFLDLVRAFYVIPFNIGLLEEHGADITGDLNEDGKFTFDDFYLEVRQKKWTYNKLIEYGAKVYSDDNEDGIKNLGDTLGMALSTGVAPSGIIYTTSINAIEWDANENRYVYPDPSPELYELFNSVKNLVNQTGIAYINRNNLGLSHPLAIRYEFISNKILFGNIILLGSLEYSPYQSLITASGLGVVPVPFYHEVGEGSDENYLTSIHNSGLPGAISSATKKFAECTAFLNYQSAYHDQGIDSNDVLNMYYNSKLAYDVLGGNSGTVEMLRYIRSNIRSTFDKTFDDAIGVYFNAYNDGWHVMLAIAGYSMDISSLYSDYAAIKSERLKALTELFDSDVLPS